MYFLIIQENLRDWAFTGHARQSPNVIPAIHRKSSHDATLLQDRSNEWAKCRNKDLYQIGQLDLFLLHSKDKNPLRVGVFWNRCDLFNWTFDPDSIYNELFNVRNWTLNQNKMNNKLKIHILKYMEFIFLAKKHYFLIYGGLGWQQVLLGLFFSDVVSSDW